MRKDAKTSKGNYHITECGECQEWKECLRDISHFATGLAAIPSVDIDIQGKFRYWLIGLRRAKQKPRVSLLKFPTQYIPEVYSLLPFAECISTLSDFQIFRRVEEQQRHALIGRHHVGFSFDHDASNLGNSLNAVIDIKFLEDMV